MTDELFSDNLDEAQKPDVEARSAAVEAAARPNRR